MSELNTEHNRVVWFDIPVLDLDRACRFYRAVLDIDMHQERFENFSFAVLHHGPGNGGCLVPRSGTEATGAKGPLIYLNVNGRLDAAVAQVASNGGQVIEPARSIGPHGFRAVVQDSEGNRVALHSQ